MLPLSYQCFDNYFCISQAHPSRLREGRPERSRHRTTSVKTSLVPLTKNGGVRFVVAIVLERRYGLRWLLLLLLLLMMMNHIRVIVAFNNFANKRTV